MGRHDLADPSHLWGVRSTRQAAKDDVNAFLDAWLLALPSRDAAVALLQRHRVPVGPVLSIDEVVQDAELRAVGSIRVIQDPGAGELVVPGFPLRFSATPVRESDAPAPRLGEHNREVVLGLAGRDDAAYAELLAAGVLHASDPA